MVQFFFVFFSPFQTRGLQGISSATGSPGQCLSLSRSTTLVSIFLSYSTALQQQELVVSVDCLIDRLQNRLACRLPDIPLRDYLIRLAFGHTCEELYGLGTRFANRGERYLITSIHGLCFPTVNTIYPSSSTCLPYLLCHGGSVNQNKCSP